MTEEQEPTHAEPEAPTVEEDLGEFDYMDPLKRERDAESPPGLDPIIPPVPPEE